MHLNPLWIGIFLYAGMAQAGCLADQHPILSCQIQNSSKVLTSCQDGTTATYSFGPPDAVELSILSPVETLDYTPWNGIGRSIYEQVIFENAGVGYLLWTAFEKDPEAKHPLSGGIIVQQNGADLASLTCAPGTIVTGIDALFEVMERHGRCWDYSDRAWGDCQ